MLFFLLLNKLRIYINIFKIASKSPSQRHTSHSQKSSIRYKFLLSKAPLAHLLESTEYPTTMRSTFPLCFTLLLALLPLVVSKESSCSLFFETAFQLGIAYLRDSSGRLMSNMFWLITCASGRKRHVLTARCCFITADGVFSLPSLWFSSQVLTHLLLQMFIVVMWQSEMNVPLISPNYPPWFPHVS